MQSDDEFQDVKKGLPSEGTANKASVKYVTIYIVIGVLLAILVIGFGPEICEALGSCLLAQRLIAGFLALLVGSLQAMIFRSKIKSRLHVFVLFSLLGGVVGGIVGGLMYYSAANSGGIIGAIIGLLAGGISSLGQNKLMGNTRYGTRWFLYNTISWAVIFAIAWSIGWQEDAWVNVAIAAAFIMIASGIGLVIFLRTTPQVEFS
jgi:hypothetical protein